jgi:hypothetical protein
MTVLLAVCAVVVTVAIAITAVVTMRAIRRFEKTAEILRGAIAHSEAVIHEVHELTDSLGSVVTPLRRAAGGVEQLSDRAVRISSAVLDEIERPVRTTLALINGVRTGTRSLVGALTRRAQHTQSNGGNRDV